MRRFLLPLLIVSLSASGTLAANNPPLAQGQPAGLHQARLQNGTMMLAIGGLALVGIGIALATAGNGSAPPSTVSTTSTSSNSP